MYNITNITRCLLSVYFELTQKCLLVYPQTSSNAKKGMRRVIGGLCVCGGGGGVGVWV